MATKERRVLTIIAWSVSGSLAAVFAFDNGVNLAFRVILERTLAYSIFSGSCVALCVYGLPTVVPAARKHLPLPLDWIAILAALVAFGAIGTLLGGIFGLVTGFISTSQPFGSWYWPSVRIAVYFTVIFGVSGVAVRELRARLASTTLALRTKERDEAEARRLAVEAQLASLESRVDPHFLFNTLNSIAALVRENPAAAERVIEQFASLMRSSLDRRAALVSLTEELALVRSYLEIERVRFGERLRFRIDVDAGVERALVPRMSLQTLTENAVKYAVSPSRDGALVVVSAAADNGTLRLAVEDNGPGFDASHLPDGHGLQLLRSRLAMTFGEKARLMADSQAGRTSITMTLPFTETWPTMSESAHRDTPGQDIPCL